MTGVQTCALPIFLRAGAGDEGAFAGQSARGAAPFGARCESFFAGMVKPGARLLNALAFAGGGAPGAGIESCATGTEGAGAETSGAVTGSEGDGGGGGADAGAAGDATAWSDVAGGGAMPSAVVAGAR